MSRKFKIIMAIVLVGMLAACIVVYQNKANDTIESKNVSRMVEQAEHFFAKGDYENGIYQLNVYLQIQQQDTDTWRLLGERYEEQGNIESALACYREIAYLESQSDENADGIELTTANPSYLVMKSMSDPYVEISVDVKYTRGMSLKVSEKNLTPDKRYYGMVAGASVNLQGADTSRQTTDWFSVDEAGGHLTLTGAFNQAVWQFRDAKGNLKNATNVTAVSFRDKASVSMDNKGYATVAIPEGAVEARVTYWNDNLSESTGETQSEIYINYGILPEAVSNSGITEYPLPDLEEGDIIRYSEGSWQLIRKNGESEILADLGELQLSQGQTISISGELCGSVVVTDQASQDMVVTDGVYGIRWKEDEQSPIFERVGDAVNLQFNYQTGDGTWAYPLEKNDFDQIYPWSEMKLCAIDAAGGITYSDDPGFARDGSCGDIMVEIPVHYFKREMIDGYQYIWISATEREGFTIDPAFVTENGVQEHVYVAAYLTSVENDTILHSKSDTYVALSLTGNEIKSFASNKGSGWESLDLVTLQMIQRLFMVETGIRNSQMLFNGNVSYVFGSVADRDSIFSTFAVSGDGSESNVIELANSSRNRVFEIGDVITVFNVDADNTNFYGVLDDGYQNNENWNRTILNVTATTKSTLLIEFSGPPVNIISRQTMMMHLPAKNGRADDIVYHTGETESSTGKCSFKYRNLENLWGNVSVILDGAEVYEQVVTVTYPNGTVSNLSYQIPFQEQTSSVSPGGDVTTISDIGLDPGNSAIMLPSGVGEGACATDGFGDSLFYESSEEMEGYGNILVYGGSWDVRQYAGLFDYRIDSYVFSDVVEFGSRLIYR